MTKVKDSGHFCIVPFSTIILEPSGDIGICRLKGTEFSFGNIKDNTLEEIWNSPKLNEWRDEFISGNIDICSREMKHMRCHMCGKNNEMLKYVDFENLKKPKILKLTANFNGQCNLQCQMCHIWKMPNGLYDEINFWSYAKENLFPHIVEIDMLSGEPLIQQDTYRLINEVSEINPECRWSITTNAHWKLGQKITSHLDKIKLKQLMVSIDSLDEKTYYKIRYPGKLKLVLGTVDDIIQYNHSRDERGLGKFDIYLNFLAQKDNWREIPKLLKYTESKGIIPHIIYLYEPEEFSLDTLSLTEKQEVIDFLLSNVPKAMHYLIQRVLYPLIGPMPIIDKKANFLKMLD